MARERGIPVHVGPISLGELLEADEVFFTGTAAEVTPIAEIDDRRFSGRPADHGSCCARPTPPPCTRTNDPLHPEWRSLTVVRRAGRPASTAPRAEGRV